MEKETYFWISWIIAGIVWYVFWLNATRNDKGYLTYSDIIVNFPVCAICGWLLVIATIMMKIFGRLDGKKLFVKRR